MAGKAAPINQQIVFELIAKSQNVEATLKSVLDKFKSSNLSDAFSKSFVNSLQKILDKTREMQKIISETGDVNTKTVNDWTRAYNKLSSDIVSSVSKIENSSIDFKDIINYDKKEFDRLKDELKKVQDAQKDIYDPKGARIQKLDVPKAVPTKLNKEILANLDDVGKVNDLLDVQNNRIQQAASNQSAVSSAIEKQITNYETIKKLLAEIEAQSTIVRNDQRKAAKEVGVDLTGLNKASSIKELKNAIEATNIDELNADLTKSNTQLEIFKQQIKEIAAYRTELVKMASELDAEFKTIAKEVNKAKEALNTFKDEAVQRAGQELSELGKDAGKAKDGLDGIVKSTEEFGEELTRAEQRQNFFSDIRSKVTQLFGLASAFQVVRRFINEAWIAIKELDAAFTEIAVVTQYSTSDLWKSFDTYNKMAQQLGVTTVDAIKTSALYYQQGLETKDVMMLTTETIKMARIANMDYAEATKAMTAAIRGFKMEMSEAQTIVDIYSALAAEAAVDTQDLATAISKTASIAGNAGLSFESTSAFLTQIIETTQEAAETAGTALKTIIARFTELKKNPLILSVEVEGEAVDANKIEAALRLADVDLRDSNQQFRDLDTVFLELSKTWNTLGRNTQRYIATVAAGSRQQSRFIAMMDNYERTVELVGIANNSANASEIQFAKTLDSVAAKVNKLQTSFQELMGKLVENKAVKGFLEFLNNILQTLNNVADQGIVAFTTFLVTIGIIVKNALMAFIGLFQTVSKQWEATKVKISESIIVKLGLDTTLAETQYNKLRQMMGLPVTIPITPATPGSPEFIGPLPQNMAGNSSGDTKTAGTKIGNGIGASIAQGAKSAIIPGLIAIFASGDLLTGLIPVIGSLFTSVLSNPVVTKAIGKGVVALFSSPIGIIIVLVAAVGFGLWKWLDPLERAKREVKAAREEFQKMQEAAEESRAAFLTEQDKFKTLAEQKTRYKELEDAISLTVEEQKELNDLSNNLAEQFPELVSYYDQAGNAVLKESEAWNDILETQRQITIETQKQYGTDLIASAQSEEKLRLAEIKKTEEEISRVRLKSYWFGITKDRLKELDRLNGKLTDLQAQGQKTQATLSGAIKIISQSSLSLKGIIEDIDLSPATQEIGQKIVSSETQEFSDFIERYKNASEKEREDLISTINPLLKDYFQNNEEDILSGDLDFISDAADIITNNLFNELSQIDGDKISQALSDVANTTEEEFRKTVISIIGKDNPLVEQVVALFSEADEQYQKSLRVFAKEDTIASLVEESGGGESTWTKIYEEWARGGEGSVRAYAESINMTPEQTNKILNQLQSALSQSDAYRIGEKWGKDVVAELVSKYGEDAPNIATFIEGTNTDIEQQKILATGDYSSVEGIMDIYSALSDTTSIEQAQSLIIQVMTQIDDAVDKTAVTFKSSTVNIASALTNSGKRVQKYSKVFSDMAKNINELTESELNDLMEDLPGSAELFKQVADGTMEWKDAVQGLKDIAFANDLYEVQKAIVGVQDALADSGKGSYEAAVALKELGMTQADWTANQDIIQAVLNGDSEAIWGYIDSVWGATSATQILNGVSLDNMNQQIASVTGVGSSQIQALTTDMIDYARVLESLGMGTVKTVTVDVPPSADDWFMGYRDTQKKTLTYFEYIPTKGKPFTSTYTAPKPKSSGGSKKEYTTKVDKYYNEIQAIDLLQDKLQSLSDARERGDLTPEQYRENLSATDKYYAELQNKLHQYNEMLRADQKALAKDINSSGYGDALKVVNGQLLVNKAAIEGTSAATQEEIDNQIEAYESLTEAIKDNSEEWWKAQEEQVKLLEQSRDAYLDLEQKIINILIEQDQKEIENTQKKYEALKQQDQDYLDALRKNISDRRKARDKEESYSDLAKKEKRLALLKRDTSGMYASDIIALEEELRQMRQDISDQETDDMVTKLEEEAQTRASNYDAELEEMNNFQKDKEDSMEYYNNRANIIMTNGYSDMINWLKKYDSEYLKSSETAQSKFIESWKKTIMEASALYDLTTFSMSPEERKTTAHSDADTARTTLQEAGYTKGAADISSHGAEGSLDWYKEYIMGRTDLTDEVKLAFWEIVKAKYRYDGKTIPTFPGFSEGGLVDYTGLAMVHGSSSKPESFLSAEDTNNFLTLSQLLGKALSFYGNTDAAQEAAGTTIMGDCNITVEVGSIANDYDVERMIEVIKQRILEGSGYRNINLIKQVR